MKSTHSSNHQVIFFPQEVQTLFPGQPSLYRISYQDWTNGYQQIMHCHADITEILLLLAGTGHYSIGAQRYPIRAGDVILCNGGVVHDEFPKPTRPIKPSVWASRAYSCPICRPTTSSRTIKPQFSTVRHSLTTSLPSYRLFCGRPTSRRLCTCTSASSSCCRCSN